MIILIILIFLDFLDYLDYFDYFDFFDYLYYLDYLDYLKYLENSPFPEIISSHHQINDDHHINNILNFLLQFLWVPHPLNILHFFWEGWWGGSALSHFARGPSQE